MSSETARAENPLDFPNDRLLTSVAGHTREDGEEKDRGHRTVGQRQVWRVCDRESPIRDPLARRSKHRGRAVEPEEVAIALIGEDLERASVAAAEV